MMVRPLWADSGKSLYEPGSVGQTPDLRCSAPRYSTDHLQTECSIILPPARVQIARCCRASVAPPSCSRNRCFCDAPSSLHMEGRCEAAQGGARCRANDLFVGSNEDGAADGEIVRVRADRLHHE